MRALVALTVMALVSLAAPPARAGELQTDLQARRARVMSALDAGTLFIAWSAPPAVYSRDVDYEYRQDSNLLYLTGITQEGTILVLMPGNEKHKEILFIHKPDPTREQWTGHMLTQEEARAASGVETIYWTDDFDPFVGAMFNQRPFAARRTELVTEYDAFFEAAAAARARLTLIFNERPDPNEPLTAPYEFAARARDRFVGTTIVDATPIVNRLRQVKTSYEQRILERSLAISSDAHLAGMRTAAPGRFEYQVEAAIEQVYLANGAMSWAYPSIVASGPNATVLHYEASTRQMQPGDLLLVDAAADYQGMSGDITRTYPVSGTFSEPQKDIYRIVLAAQHAGIDAARAGNRTHDIEVAVENVVRAGLLTLGLTTDAAGDQFRVWYPHGICHWIGLDVHDVGDYRRPLEPGMAFTIEPGIYIRQESFDALPDTPENRAFKAKVKDTVAKYRNIGIRLEDSFLLTDSGPKRLSEKVPYTIEGIEAVMKTRPAQTAGAQPGPPARQ